MESIWLIGTGPMAVDYIKVFKGYTGCNWQRR
jgi:hypothetical protein